MAIVTNIDADHLSTYDGDFEKLKNTFVEFLEHLPFYGLAIVCTDDVHVQEVIPRLTRPVLSYGADEKADVWVSNISQKGLQTFFDVRMKDGRVLEQIVLNLPGHHNVLNATAAIALAAELEVPDEAIRAALESFAGIGRRVQPHGNLMLGSGKGSAQLYDDYGHHPTEVKATIQAIRAGWPESRLVVVFQPHRYTRTHDLFEDFAEALSQPAVLVLTEVYSAGEEKINGADGRALARAIRNRGQVDPIFVEDIDKVPEQLESVLQDGDVLLTLGAGSVGGLANALPLHFNRDLKSVGG